MATVSTPVVAWISSLQGTAQGLSGSTSYTVTVNITGAWEIQVPVKMGWISNVSADGVINAFPSNDGGANYDSNPSFSISIARVIGGSRQTSIRLPVGQWALQILQSGPSSGSAAILTAMVVTAVVNQ